MRGANGLDRKESIDALFMTKSPFERPLTRHKGGRARFSYELHINGTLLQGGDDLNVLLKNVSEKLGAIITRTRDSVIVYPTDSR